MYIHKRVLDIYLYCVTVTISTEFYSISWCFNFSSPLKDNSIKTQATTSGSSTTTTTTTTTANLAVKRKADVTDTPPTKKQKKKKNKEGDKMSKNDLLNTPVSSFKFQKIFNVKLSAFISSNGHV